MEVTLESGSLSKTVLNGAYLLYQMRQDEIGKHWEVIKMAIEASHPHTHLSCPAYVQRVQDRIMHGVMEVWVGHNEEGRPVMIAVTEEVKEAGTLEPTLLIYALYGIQNPDIGCWKEWFRRLMNRAGKKGIKRIIAYTEHENMANVAQRLGADATYRLLEWRL